MNAYFYYIFTKRNALMQTNNNNNLGNYICILKALETNVGFHHFASYTKLNV